MFYKELLKLHTFRGIEYNALVEKLEKKYNKDIILKKIIDPEILGGIYVRIGNDVIVEL